MDNLDTNSTSHTMSNTELKEKFVQNLNGSSMEDVMSFLSQVPLFVFITIFIELCILKKMNFHVYKTGSVNLSSSIVVFLIEFFSIVIPIVFMFTLLSDSILLVFLITSTLIFLIIIHSVSSPDDSVQYWKLLHFKDTLFSEDVLIGKQPFITYFRALTFLVTSISILGVDFHAYPRRFAKTETYGVSLMDIGVGLFVLSNAVVVKTGSLLVKELKTTFLESLVFLVLGVARYFLLQHLDYQKHVTEYGVHWNFFITLALVKILSHILLKVFKGYSFICGLPLMLIHQYLLKNSLENFVLSNSSRGDWLSANREGLVSLGGYLSLYLIGVSLASIFDPQGRRSFSVLAKNRVCTLGLLVTLSVILFGVLYWFSVINFQMSRRLANLPYVIWVVAVGTTLIAITLIVELLSICFLPIQQRLRSKIYSVITPAILESINYNGLAFFLVSNLLTGLINISIDVFRLETYPSIMVLVSYMLVNCAFMFFLHVYNIKIKIW